MTGVITEQDACAVGFFLVVGGKKGDLPEVIPSVVAAGKRIGAYRGDGGPMVIHQAYGSGTPSTVEVVQALFDGVMQAPPTDRQSKDLSVGNDPGLEEHPLIWILGKTETNIKKEEWQASGIGYNIAIGVSAETAARLINELRDTARCTEQIGPVNSPLPIGTVAWLLVYCNPPTDDARLVESVWLSKVD